MCFTKTFHKNTTNKAILTPKIAKQDIVVYKVINSDGIGWLFTDTPWKMGDVNIAEPSDLYPSIKDIKNGPSWDYGEEGKKLNIAGGWFHSSKTIKHLNIVYKSRSWDDILVKMIIPAGTEYFENNNEYVSKQLKYVENEFYPRIACRDYSNYGNYIQYYPN
jgi:hypothetical protein